MNSGAEISDESGRVCAYVGRSVVQFREELESLHERINSRFGMYLVPEQPVPAPSEKNVNTRTAVSPHHEAVQVEFKKCSGVLSRIHELIDRIDA